MLTHSLLRSIPRHAKLFDRPRFRLNVLSRRATTGWTGTLCPAMERRGSLSRRLRSRFDYLPAFRSLIARYLFSAFEAGPLVLYSVGVRDPKSTGEEFRYAIFDAIMFPFLLDKGLLRFARPHDWSYDPVCFDFRNANRKSEPGVVRVDHEEILCNDRLCVIETISPAFHELMEDMTGSLQNDRKTRS